MAESELNPSGPSQSPQEQLLATVRDILDAAGIVAIDYVSEIDAPM